MAKKRWFKKKEKGLLKGYDSLLEQTLHQGPLAGCDHHVGKISYTVEHEYEPDFIHPKEPKVLIEVKGRFRDSVEASKYKWIRDCNPGIEIVFVFEKRGTRFPFAKKRKDGTYMTHEEWAEKNGFEYYFPDTLPERWKK